MLGVFMHFGIPSPTKEYISTKGPLKRKYRLFFLLLIVPVIFLGFYEVYSRYDQIKQLEEKRQDLSSIQILIDLASLAELHRDLSLISTLGSDLLAAESYGNYKKSLIEQLNAYLSKKELRERFYFFDSAKAEINRLIVDLNNRIGLEYGAEDTLFEKHHQVVMYLISLQDRIIGQAGLYSSDDSISSQLLFFIFEDTEPLFFSLAITKAYGGFYVSRGFMASEGVEKFEKAYDKLQYSSIALPNKLQDILHNQPNAESNLKRWKLAFQTSANIAEYVDKELLQSPDTRITWETYLNKIANQAQIFEAARHEILEYVLATYQLKTQSLKNQLLLVTIGLSIMILIILYIYREDRKEARLRVDAQKQKMVAEAATEVKSEFLANMSHEIRTPINGITGVAELFSYTSLDDEQKQYLLLIQQSSQSLLAIINDILDYSKIEAGKIEIEQINFDVPQLIENCISLFTPALCNKPLALICTIHAEVPCEMLGDPTRIRQILLNFVSNAVKFTDRGCVNIEVSMQESKRGKQLKFSVQDTGIGIKQEQVDTLFRAFEQADSSITRKYGGTGLGLTISKKLTSLMNGTIGARPRSEGGTEFWFSVPIIEPSSIPFSKWIDSKVQRISVFLFMENRFHQKQWAYLLTIWGFIIQVPASIKELAGSLKCLNEGNSASTICFFDDKSAENFLESSIYNQVERSVPFLIFGDPNYNVNQADNESFKDGIAETKKYGLGMQPYRVKSTLPISDFQRVIKKIQGLSVEAKPVNYELNSSFNNISVLVAEDNRVNQLVIAGMLKRLNANSVIVNNGEEAFTAYQSDSEDFDLILMDWEMPVMDGISATHRIRDWEQKNNKNITPIIALTAHASVDYEKRALKSGMQGYLVKPITIDKLTKEMELSLNLKKTQHPVTPLKPD